MASEKWTPRFGDKAVVIGPNCKGYKVVVLSINKEHKFASVAFEHGGGTSFKFDQLEPAPDPAVTKLVEAAQALIGKLDTHFPMPIDLSNPYYHNFAGIRNEFHALKTLVEDLKPFAAKGGAE